MAGNIQPGTRRVLLPALRRRLLNLGSQSLAPGPDVHTAFFDHLPCTSANCGRAAGCCLEIVDRSLESIKMLMVTAQESQCETPISSSFGCSTLARRCA